MMFQIKAKDEDGNVKFEGEMNAKEASFLIQYAVNDLIMAGVQFHLEEPDTGESRIKFGKATH